MGHPEWDSQNNQNGDRHNRTGQKDRQNRTSITGKA
jgi:hypothetical protein